MKNYVWYFLHMVYILHFFLFRLLRNIWTYILMYAVPRFACHLATDLLALALWIYLVFLLLVFYGTSILSRKFVRTSCYDMAIVIVFVSLKKYTYLHFYQFTNLQKLILLWNHNVVTLKQPNGRNMCACLLTTMYLSNKHSF